MNAMKKICAILATLFLASNIYAANDPRNKTSNKSQSGTSLHSNDMHFTPNKGQIADASDKFCPDVLYKGDGGGADIYLRRMGISYVFNNMNEVMHEVDEQVEGLEKSGDINSTNEQETRQHLMQNQILKIHRVDMDFVGGNLNAEMQTFDEIGGYTNYYYAHCPQGITNIHQYNKVTCKNIYNNIDISYYGNNGSGIKYDIIVNPHADPGQIRLRWAGMDELKI